MNEATTYLIAPCSYFRSFLTDEIGFDADQWDKVLYFAVGEQMHNKTNPTTSLLERFNEAQRNLGITLAKGITPEHCFGMYKRDVLSNEKSPKGGYKKKPTFALNKNKWFSIRDNGGMEHFEMVLLFAYLSLKSIQGARSYARATNSLWLSRMACNSKVTKKLPPVIKAFDTIYKCRKLREAMQKYYHIAFYIPKGARGFYFSTNKDVTPDVIKASLEAKKNRRKV